jgi:hypothetical protein
MVVDILGKKEKVLCALLAGMGHHLHHLYHRITIFFPPGSWIVTTDFIDKCAQQS